MGRQINFYMSEEVDNKLIEFLKEQNFEFLFYDFKNNALVRLYEIKYSEFSQEDTYLYKPEYGDLHMKDGPLVDIDQITSPVIEFTRTKIVYDKKIVRRGRIWVETKYYDSSGELVEKKEEFVKDYNRLVRWIKKNVPFQEIPKGDFLVKEYTNDELMELVNQGYRLTI
jgi:hypothetical protein